MHLYILTPYNGEPASVYAEYLKSINDQIDIDFNNITVVISRCNYGGFPDITNYSNLKSRVVFISQLYDKTGPGQSRQVGLDYIKSVGKDDDYLIFLDIDDKLYANDTLKFLLTPSTYEGVDVKEFAGFRYDTKTNSYNWVQGIAWEVWTKLIRIGFLRWNNINFSKKLVSAEDCFFTTCVSGITGTSYQFDFKHSYCIHNDILDSSTLWVFLRKASLDSILDDSIICIEEFLSWTETISMSVKVETLYSAMKGLMGFIDGRLETASVQEILNTKDKFIGILDRWYYLIQINGTDSSLIPKMLSWIEEKRKYFED